MTCVSTCTASTPSSAPAEVLLEHPLLTGVGNIAGSVTISPARIARLLEAFELSGAHVLNQLLFGRIVVFDLERGGGSDSDGGESEELHLYVY